MDGVSEVYISAQPALTERVLDDEDYSRATCDGCGPSVRARVVVALPSGGILCYCFHHGNKYRQALEAKGALVLELSQA